LFGQLAISLVNFDCIHVLSVVGFVRLCSFSVSAPQRDSVLPS
jgi:hypothetical protein